MKSRFAIGAFFALVMLVGCGSTSSDMGTVTGVVTLDGKPVGNASVVFYPTDGRSSVGNTDAEGKYQLAQTRDRIGAAKGTHVVTVVQEKASLLDEGVEKVNLPKKYSDKEKSDLTATVEGGSNEINFELKSE